MKYIVDIDNTICHTEGNDYPNSKPIKNRIRIINDLYDNGHHITYWTARGMSTGKDWEELTKSQLSDWGVKYHELKMKKPSYDLWIDDKAFNSRDYFGVDFD